MKKNFIVKVFIVVIIFICAISIIEIMKYIRENEIVDGIYTQKDIDIMNEEVKEYLSDKITPKGISKLYGNYEGENDLNDIYRSIYSFVNYLPNLSKKIKYDEEESIVSYYEKNKRDIKDNLCITKQDEFVKFIGYLNKVGYHGDKFISSEIDASTFEIKKRYFSFSLKLNFENINNDFYVKLNFANSKSTEPEIYYSLLEEEN